MASRIKGITIEIGGDATGLDKALKGVDKELQQTQSKLNDVNKLLKLDPKNTDLLKQKQAALKDAIGQTSDRLKTLKDAAKNVTPDSIGQDKYDALQREIADTEGKLESLQDQYKEFGSVAKQQLEAVGGKMKEVGGKISDVGTDMSAKVSAPIVAAGTAAAKLGSDYEENLNKIDVAFGDSAGEVRDWADTARDSFGLSKVQATEAVSSFGALGKGIGLSEDEAADMATTLAGLSSDLGSYFNVSNEDSAAALEGIFTGEGEALKKFGVVMNDTNMAQFAADNGKVWKEMSQSEKTTLRYQYVLAQTKDAQGDFARTSDGTANSTKLFQAALSDAGVAIGTQLLPIITPLIQKVTEIIGKFSSLSPATQKVITIVGLVIAAIGPLLVVIGTVISSIGAILPVLGMLLGPVGLVVAAIAAAITIGIALYKNWDTIKAKAKAFATAIKQKFDEIKTNISNAINTAKTAVQTVFENIRTAITTKVQAARTVVQTTFDNIKSKIQNAINSAKTTVSTAVGKIKGFLNFSGVASKVKEVFDSVKSKITDPVEKAKEKIKEWVGDIKGFFNFTMPTPHVKLPHFSITPAGWKVKDLLQGSIPTLGVTWQKKAMNNPYLLKNATLFGAGEAGNEMVVGWDALRRELGGRGTNINITVNPAPGMDETALANMVMRKMQNAVDRRKSVWA